MTLDEYINKAEEKAKMAEFDTERGIGNHFIDRTEALEYAKECRQLVEWLKELKQLREQTRWIPVSERLPTREEYIANNGLFIVTDGNRTYAEYFDVYNSGKYFGEPTMSGLRIDRCVIAWRPLPEPYREEREE